MRFHNIFTPILTLRQDRCLKTNVIYCVSVTDVYIIVVQANCTSSLMLCKAKYDIKRNFSFHRRLCWQHMANTRNVNLLSFVLVFNVFIYFRLFNDVFSNSDDIAFELVRMRWEAVVA